MDNSNTDCEKIHKKRLVHLFHLMKIITKDDKQKNYKLYSKIKSTLSKKIQSLEYSNSYRNNSNKNTNNESKGCYRIKSARNNIDVNQFEGNLNTIYLPEAFIEIPKKFDLNFFIQLSKDILFFSILFLVIGPVSILAKFLWLITLCLSKIFPNLDESASSLDIWYEKLIYTEEETIDKITFLD